MSFDTDDYIDAEAWGMFLKEQECRDFKLLSSWVDQAKEILPEAKKHFRDTSSFEQLIADIESILDANKDV